MIDTSKVEIENVGFPVRESMLVEGKVDAITAFSFSSYMNLRGRGIAQDVKRLMRSIDQIGERFKFTNKPKADDIFDAAYLPPKAERTIKQ